MITRKSKKKKINERMKEKIWIEEHEKKNKKRKNKQIKMENRKKEKQRKTNL